MTNNTQNRRQWSFSILLAAAMALALTLPPTAHALPRTAIVAQGGSLGLGGALYLGLPRSTDVRFGVSYFSVSHTVTSGGIDYDGTVRPETFALLGDWHPFHGIFGLTAGAVYNANQIGLTGTPQPGGIYVINGHPYTSSQVGILTGKATWGPIDPYFGFGLGNPFRGGHWTAGLDVGVIYQGAPKVNLYATGEASNPQLASDIQAEEPTVRHTLSRYTQWYPVVMLSVGYRF